MKKLFFVIAVISINFVVTAQEVGINWISLEEAVSAQAKEPRKIIMDMYTTWCGPCRLLDKNTFQNKDVADYINENFYAVKFNAEGDSSVKFKGQNFSNPNYDASREGKRNSQHQLAGYFGVTAYPTIVFIDENGGLIAPIKGYQAPNQLEIFLKLFATNKYKEVTTKEQWEQYQKEFKFEFKS